MLPGVPLLLLSAPPLAHPACIVYRDVSLACWDICCIVRAVDFCRAEQWTFVGNSSMPANEGGKHHGDGAATLVRSDQDSGMALVKSKDGRTKWLTVRCACRSIQGLAYDTSMR